MGASVGGCPALGYRRCSWPARSTALQSWGRSRVTTNQPTNSLSTQLPCSGKVAWYDKLLSFTTTLLIHSNGNRPTLSYPTSNLSQWLISTKALAAVVFGSLFAITWARLASGIFNLVDEVVSRLLSCFREFEMLYCYPTRSQLIPQQLTAGQFLAYFKPSHSCCVSAQHSWTQLQLPANATLPTHTHNKIDMKGSHYVTDLHTHTH